MNLEDLQSARNRERRTDSLQPLPNSFYDDAAAFVRELRARRDEVAATADDPFDSPDVRRLTNSIKTAENTVEAIYERRVGKVVKLASLDAAGMTTDDDGLTTEERDLFGTLTEAIEHHRTHVIEGLGATDGDDSGPTEIDGTTTAASATEPAAGTGEPDTEGTGTEANTPSAATAHETEAASTVERATAGSQTPPPDDAGREAISAADVMGAPAGTAGAAESDTEPVGAETNYDAATSGAAGPESPEATAPGSEPTVGTDRETIRITRDVGEIVGIDERVYDLANEDVVTLPAANAKPLVDRNAAERLG